MTLKIKNCVFVLLSHHQVSSAVEVGLVRVVSRFLALLRKDSSTYPYVKDYQSLSLSQVSEFGHSFCWTLFDKQLKVSGVLRTYYHEFGFTCVHFRPY